MSTRPAKKLLLIGWDAADWQVISPMLDAGLLPTLNRLINEGVMGNLGTLRPVLSPMLWTSIATGKRATKHGICSFIEPQPDGSGVRPVTSTSRKAKALWNIASQNGLTSSIVNWYASDPAEPIRGTCVSEAFVRSASANDLPIPPQSIYPESRGDELAELRVMPQDITGHHIGPFVPTLGEIPAEKTGPVAGIRKMLAKCATTHAVITDLLEHEPWDFAAVYYDAIDHFGHAFMHYHPPQLEGIPAEEFERYKECITGIYRFHDMMLERLLQLAGDDATVMLVSDHGFLSNELRPVNKAGQIAGPEAWHRDHGIFVLRGPGIRKDERVHGATLLDIAPTVLALLGLPVGQDMEGRVLTQCFEKWPHVATVESWETIDGPHPAGMHPPEMQVNPVDQQAALQQLVDLGYIEVPSEDTSKAIALARAEIARNLAASFSEAGDHAKAVELLEPLVAADPTNTRYTTALAQAYFLMSRYAETRTVILNASDGAPEARTPYLSMLLGSVELAEGNFDAALDHLRQAEKIEPRVPALHVQIGNAYARRRFWDDARRAYQKALSLNPDEATAHYGLGLVELRQGRFEEAAAHSLKAVGLTHYFPRAHLQLGIALARLGRFERAIQAAETALSLQPNSHDAHRVLAAICLKAGDATRAQIHHQAARQLQSA